ncbi:hypothetical protein D3C81_1565760 [compost metagenome]
MALFDLALGNDFLQLTVGLALRVTNTGQDCLGLGDAALADQPAWRGRDEMHANIEQRGGYQGDRQHVAPDGRAIEQVRQPGTGDVGQALSGDDHQFALANQPTAMLGRRQLGDQHRYSGRGAADSDT